MMRRGAATLPLLAVITLLAACARTNTDQDQPPPPRATDVGSATSAPSPAPEPDRATDTSSATSAPPPPSPEPPPAPAFIELLPGIRVNRDAGVIEFDGYIPIDVNDLDPLGYYKVVFLECVVTTPRAEKDHETLVVADITPSSLHAALLAIGAEPGAPGDWRWDGREVHRIPARGDEIEVTLVWQTPDGAIIERSPRDLIVNETTGARFGGSAWVFAGSIEDPAAPDAAGVPYAADATGLLVGLATFGTEVIALREIISHEAQIDAPTWIANRATTPPYNTPITVRLQRAP